MTLVESEPSSDFSVTKSADRARGGWLGSAKITLFAMRIGLGVGLIILWWAVSQTTLVRPALNHGPADVWNAVVTLEGNGLLWSNLGATLAAAAIALVLSGVVGTICGLTLALLPKTEQVVAPYLSAVNAMPRIALAPVFIIYFGIGMSAKVALAFTVVVFMFLLNTHAAVRSCDPDIVRLMRVLGATKLQRFFKVLLPVAVPQIIASVRLGIVYSLLGVVASELISSRNGIGQIIASSSSTFDLATVYGSLLILAVVAAALDVGAKAAENRLLRWDTEVH